MRVLLFLFALFCPVTTLATVGFSAERIWLSREPVFAGDTMTISTLVVNSGGELFSGDVVFFNNGIPIGTSSARVVPGEATVISLPWMAQEGTLAVSASLVPRFQDHSPVLGLSKERLKTGTFSIVVDEDTDKDRIGNRVDTDDDNDGLVDTTEMQLGTNVLNPDSDGDGITDALDPLPLQKATTTTPLTGSVAVATSSSRVSVLPSLTPYLPRALHPIASSTIGALDDIRLANADIADSLVADTLGELLVDKQLVQATSTATSSQVREATGGWKEMARSIDSGDLLETPFTYVKLFFSLLYQFLTTNVWGFYIALLFLVGWLIRLLSSIFHR